MWLTIARKEFMEALRTPRFIVTALLCLILLPAALFVNIREYDQRLIAYAESKELLTDPVSSRSISYDSEWKGLRPPSPYSPFYTGLEPLLPNKFTVSRDGFALSNEQWTANPQSVLFGQLDLFFFVSFALSLLAFVFASAALAAERESGELMYTMTAPVTRRELLTGKILGNYLSLSTPFLFGLVVALPLLWISPAIRSDLTGTLTYLALFAAISLLFLFCQMMIAFLLLLFIPARAAGLNVLLFTWVLLTVVLPKTTPIVAGLVHPAGSRELADLTRRQLRQKFEYEFKRDAIALFDSTMRLHGLDPNTVHSPMSPDASAEEKTALNAYWDQARAIEKENHERLDLDLARLEETQSALSDRQRSTTLVLSRLSPFSWFGNVIAAISANGPQELEVLLKNAHEFQAEAREKVYNRFSVRYYGLAGTVITADSTLVPSHAAASIPVLTYRRPNLAQTLAGQWPDLVLLVILPIVCVAFCLNRFSRFDVR